jgi:hypothetical protein
LPVEGSEYVTDVLTNKLEDHFGATWSFEPDPIKAARIIIDRIDQKRADLGLPPPMYDVPYQPKTEGTAPTSHVAAAGEVMATAGSCPGTGPQIED